jgi:hypothetical protein
MAFLELVEERRIVGLPGGRGNGFIDEPLDLDVVGEGIVGLGAQWSRGQGSEEESARDGAAKPGARDGWEHG